MFSSLDDLWLAGPARIVYLPEGHIKGRANHIQRILSFSFGHLRIDYQKEGLLATSQQPAFAAVATSQGGLRQVRGQRLGIEIAAGKIELVEIAVEGGAVHAEQAGCRRQVAVGGLEGLADLVSVELDRPGRLAPGKVR